MCHLKLLPMKTFTLIMVLAFGMGYQGWAQVNISAGGTFTENFNFGASATATLTSSWKADKNTTVRTVGSYATAGTSTEQRAGNNMSSTAPNGIYNFGAGEASTATDRSLGGLSSSTASKSVNLYLLLHNDGTSSVNDFTVSYTVEKYRAGTNAAGFSVQLYYSADGNAWTSAGPDFLTSFAGADPANTGYAIAPGDTGYITAKTLPVTLAPGSSLYLAWNYSVTTGSTTTSAQALGIDDVSITANGTSGSGSYTWNQTGTADWTMPANWTPVRTSPQASDILQFTHGSSCVITHVPSQAIARMILSGNTGVSLQSEADAVLTIAGEAGTDLEVPAGCSLNLGGVHAVSIALGNGATGSIGGSLAFSSSAETANRLTATDPGAITFNFGSTFTAGALSSGNPFGTASLESVVFTNGSTLVHQGGTHPFGASQPGSVVVFQTGSLYKVTAAVPLSFSGRNYANFELDAPGATLSADGGNTVSIDNLTVTGGTLNFNMTGTPGHSIRGNISVGAGGILNFAPAAAGTVTFNGTCLQTISGTGILSAATNSTLEIANSDGIDLNMNVTTNGHLKLTNGFLNLGLNDLLLGSSSTIAGAPSSSAMIVATGAGQVKKAFSAPGSFTFPVGDHTATAEYSPVTLNFTSGIFGTGNYAGVNLVNAKYPADPNNQHYLVRYWNLTSNSISSFSCNAVFQYVPADVSGTEDQISCVKVNPLPFITYQAADPVLHLLTANGLTSFGTITGTKSVLNVYDVAGSGSYCEGSPGLPVTLSNSQVNVNYQLKKNGINAGSPVPGTGLLLTWPGQAAGTYTVEGTNGVQSIMMNGSAIIEEFPVAAVSVSIAASANPVCLGAVVAFTATAVNGGYAPSYQWKVNNVAAGTNSPTYTFSPSDNDEVTCTVTADNNCATGNPATSNAVVMTVNPVLPVSIAIAPSANPVCPNTPVTFAATPVNGGSNPQYQWKVNGVNAGTGTRTFAYSIVNNAVVTCILTSNSACVQGNTATSNTVNMVVNGIMPVGVSIAASANPVPAGTTVTFTATPVNGGTTPAYQWRVNDVNVGPGGPVYSYVPAGNDRVSCILVSNLSCVSCNPAISNMIIMTVNGNSSNKSSFVVYPNPTTGMFTLERRGDAETFEGRIELSNMQGEQIMTALLTQERKFSFSLSGSPAGVYFLRIFTSGDVETIKIDKH